MQGMSNQMLMIWVHRASLDRMHNSMRSIAWSIRSYIS
jgi:hypothetical protein